MAYKQTRSFTTLVVLLFLNESAALQTTDSSHMVIESTGRMSDAPALVRSEADLEKDAEAAFDKAASAADSKKSEDAKVEKAEVKTPKIRAEKAKVEKAQKNTKAANGNETAELIATQSKAKGVDIDIVYDEFAETGTQSSVVKVIKEFDEKACPSSAGHGSGALCGDEEDCKEICNKYAECLCFELKHNVCYMRGTGCSGTVNQNVVRQTTLFVKRCGTNTYVDDHECKACPGGRTSYGQKVAAATTESECEGQITCGENEKVVDHVCTPCEPGSTAASGADASGVNTICVPTICGLGEHVDDHKCKECEEESLNVGDDASGDDTECMVVTSLTITTTPVIKNGLRPAQLLSMVTFLVLLVAS